MSVNLISLASQYLTPEIMTRLSSVLGVNTSTIGKACSAALPALFGSFAHLASTDDGAYRLSGAVSEQSPSILDNFSQALSGSRQQDLMHEGLQSLNSLLGNSAVGGLTGAIARFAGLGQNATTSLLGMLTPALLGLLGKHTPGQGADPTALSRLLTSQKDNIAAAMPSGFKDLLQSADFSKLGGTQTVREPVRETRTTRPTTMQSSSSSSWQDSWRWIAPIVVLGLLAWGISSLINRNRTAEPPRTAEQASPPQPRVAEQTPTTERVHITETAVAGVDLKSATQKALDGVKTTLQQVTDEASAKAALPKLQTAASELDNVIQLSGKLPEAGKKTIGSVVSAAQPATTQLFNKVQAIPAANDVTKPTIDALRAKMDMLIKA